MEVTKESFITKKNKKNKPRPLQKALYDLLHWSKAPLSDMKFVFKLDAPICFDTCAKLKAYLHMYLRQFTEC